MTLPIPFRTVEQAACRVNRLCASLRAPCRTPCPHPTSGPSSPTGRRRRRKRPPSCTAKGRSPSRSCTSKSLRAAQGLADLGVGPGDRVALWLPNVPAYPILYFACARLGAIAVAVNTRYPRGRGRRHRRPLGRQGAGLRAGLPPHRLPVDPGRASIRPRSTGSPPSSWSARSRRRRRPPSSGCGACRSTRLLSRPPLGASHAAPNAPCNIFTTSGTTSAPKFVLHRQGAIAAPRPAGGARLRLRCAGHAVALHPAAVRRVRLQPDPGHPRRRQAVRAGRVLRDRRDRPADRAAPADHDVRQRRHDRPPARARAGRAAVPVGEMGGLCRLQRRAGEHRRGRRGARADPARPLRHERGAGALRPPAARCAGGAAQEGRRRAELALRPCPRARSRDRRAAGRRASPARWNARGRR